jgi:spermidine synthase
VVLYAIAGGVALGYEVVWSQAIIPFLSTRAFAFSIVLATYLTGLVVGSAAYARLAKRASDPWSVFGILIASAGLIALLQVGALGRWLLIVQTQLEYAVFVVTHSTLAGICARFAVAAFGVVFIPTLLLGAAFPAALRLAAGAEHSGRDVGAVVAGNTAGGIVGTILTGFVLVPTIGLVHTLAALAICASLIGLMACLCSHNTNRILPNAIIAVSVLSVVLAIVIPRDHLAQNLLIARGGGELVAYEESSGGTVAVIQDRGGGDVFRRLYIQGVSNSGDALPSLRYMRLQALLPLIIHRGEPKSALVIGFGTGITAGALLCYEQLEERVSAELLPAVIRAAPSFHGNFDAASSPALEIRLRDGRRELVRSPQSYDLITLEPPPPSAVDVANLYSTDFYRLASRRLRPNGLLAQWLPIAAQNADDTRSLVRSFLDVFPYATAWTTEMHEVLLVGSQSPIELDANRMAARFKEPQVAEALREVGISSPEELLALWLTDKNGLEHYAQKAPPVTDNYPRIEYATWVRPDEIVRALPEWLSLRSDPPTTGTDQASLALVAESRARLLDFYIAGVAAYNHDRESWALHIKRALHNNAGNPYYAWAVGGRRNFGPEP